MNRDELLQQINEWHEENGHQEIIDVIEALPREEWGYELTGLLARAYNNVSGTPQLEKAVSLLESVREDGKDDFRWNFRFGYALYYLHRGEEALPYFRRAAELNPDDEDAPIYIRVCEEALSPKADKQESPSELVEVFMSYLGCECEYFPL